MRRLLWLCVVVAASFAAASPGVAQEATPDACPTLSPDDTAEVARQYLDVWNTKDLSQFDTLASPDIVHHWGQAVEDTTGIDALKSNAKMFLQAFPDMQMTFDDIIVEGDMVVIRWTLTATHTGPFFGIEPTGTTAEWTGININRIECGQVTESWSEADGVSLRQQLMPQDAATPSA